LVNAFYAGLFLVLVGATNCGPDSMIAGSITMEVNLIIFSFLNQSGKNEVPNIIPDAHPDFQNYSWSRFYPKNITK
jgi:hypothetical protein